MGMAAGTPGDDWGGAAACLGVPCQSKTNRPAFGNGTLGTAEGTAVWNGKLCLSGAKRSAFAGECGCVGSATPPCL